MYESVVSSPTTVESVSRSLHHTCCGGKLLLDLSVLMIADTQMHYFLASFVIGRQKLPSSALSAYLCLCIKLSPAFSPASNM